MIHTVAGKLNVFTTFLLEVHMPNNTDKKQTPTAVSFMLGTLRQAEPTACWLLTTAAATAATAAATAARFTGEVHMAAGKSCFVQAFSGSASDFPVMPERKGPKP